MVAPHRGQFTMTPHRTTAAAARAVLLHALRHADCTRFHALFKKTSNRACSCARLAVATVTLLSTIASTAAAQMDAEADTQDQTLDGARGPINGSTRRIGLGGAFVAIADDTEGIAINP